MEICWGATLLAQMCRIAHCFPQNFQQITAFFLSFTQKYNLRKTWHQTALCCCFLCLVGNCCKYEPCLWPLDLPRIFRGGIHIIPDKPLLSNAGLFKKFCQYIELPSLYTCNASWVPCGQIIAQDFRLCKETIPFQSLTWSPDKKESMPTYSLSTDPGVVTSPCILTLPFWLLLFF